MEKYYWINEDSQTFLERGYLQLGQTTQERVRQIANEAERTLDIEGFADKFEDYMSRGWFSLASPVWANYGNEKGLPISCNSAFIDDTMNAILEKTAEVGMCTKHGAGTSAYFGALRARGTKIKVGGKSSGPVHFMELFDAVTNIVSQSNVRRGSFAAYLPVDHPDIDEFLNIRSEGNRIQNISIGVCISDAWMQALVDGDKVKRTVWAKIIQKRFESGYPYLFFTDAANRNGPQVYKDKGRTIKSSNLCVTGDQRVVSNKGLLTAKELYKLGEELVLFDNKKTVKASKMELIEKDADVYKITLANGMTHTVTKYHKVVVRQFDSVTLDVECKDLKVGDFVAIQTKKGIFGDVDKPDEAFLLGMYHSTQNSRIFNIKENFIPNWVWQGNEETLKKYIEGFYNDGTKVIDSIQLILANLGVNTEGFCKVKSIEPAGKEDVYCCTVDSDEHHWICNGIITHNCNEISLESNEDESFVCDLSSMNQLHWDDWKGTDAVEVITYFLDAVMTEYIRKCKDIPFMRCPYNFAVNQRALGLGTLGWHSYLQSKMIPFESMEAKLLNAQMFAFIKEKSQKASREMAVKYGEPALLKGYGLRNVTTMAVAPTTSSSFILGQVSPSIEPLNSNYFVKDLEKGKFAYKNPHLKELLGKYNKDNQETWNSILIKGGSVQHLEFLSAHEKDVFKTFGEISQKEIVIQAAQRQKFIDQGQSLNLMIHPKTSPKEVSDLLIEGWRLELKGFYYQRGTNPAQELGRSILACKSCEG